MNANEKYEAQWVRLARYLCHEMLPDERLSYENEIHNHTIQNDMQEELKFHWNQIGNTDEVPQVDVDNAWNKLQGRINASTTNRKKEMVRVLQVAAGFLLLVGLTIGGYFGYRSIGSKSLISATENKRMQILLPDGSAVFMNVSSTLKYPSQFDKNTRVVKLEGEAFFHVVSNPEEPFIVIAQDASVKIVGTTFNVYAREINSTEVFVEEGRVELAGKTKEENHVIIESGEIGKFMGGTITKAPCEDPNYLSWKTQKLEFHEDLLSYVFPTLEHAYHVRFKVLQPDLLHHRYTSTIINQSLENVLEALETSFQLKITGNDGLYEVTQQ